jgi:hypothetical protein
MPSHTKLRCRATEAVLVIVTAVQSLSVFATSLAQEKASRLFTIEETSERIILRGGAIEASIKKKGYVSGVEAGSFLDKETGARDLGFGLDIQDWIMEPGSDAEYRSQLAGDLPYDFNNAYHGKTPKRSIEGPQICTQAKELKPRVVEGKDFVAIEQSWTYTLAAPGKKAGSEWKQTWSFRLANGILSLPIAFSVAMRARHSSFGKTFQVT